jgi:hypothetical protein
MRLCPECRVYLSDETDACPLCRTPSVPAGDSTDSGTAAGGARPDDGIPVPPSGIRAARDAFPVDARDMRDARDDSLDELSPRERRRMVFELVSVSVAIILIVTTGIDFLISRGITWSLYSGISLAAIWILSAAPLMLWEKPALVFTVLTPAIVALSFAWFFLVGHSDLFLPLGLPITLAFEISLLGPYIIVMRQRRKGLNTAGVVLAFAGFLCIVIDASVSRFLGSAAPLSWSVIVCVSAIPVAGLFFYLHYRITNRASLRKLFRL